MLFILFEIDDYIEIQFDVFFVLLLKQLKNLIFQKKLFIFEILKEIISQNLFFGISPAACPPLPICFPN